MKLNLFKVLLVWGDLRKVHVFFFRLTLSSIKVNFKDIHLAARRRSRSFSLITAQQLLMQLEVRLSRNPVRQHSHHISITFRMNSCNTSPPPFLLLSSSFHQAPLLLNDILSGRWLVCNHFSWCRNLETIVRRAEWLETKKYPRLNLCCSNISFIRLWLEEKPAPQNSRFKYEWRSGVFFFCRN